MPTASAKKSGSYTTTYKIRFYTNNIEELKLTKEQYNKLIKKYYDLIFTYEGVLELSTQKCLRELEKLTIIGISGEKPIEYFEQNAPSELRRAAINQAIGLAKSYLELSKKNDLTQKATKFNCSVVFYKGMYKDLEPNGKVKIKLFDGEKWKWYDAKFKDWKFPEDSKALSPTLVIKKDYVMAHVPIKIKIDDITPIKERMKRDNVNVCGIAFSNTSKPVTCVIVDKNGKHVKTLFVKGGNEYKNQIRKILNKQRKNISKNKKIAIVKQNHKSYYEKGNRILNHYAHVMSRQIVNFCIENDVQIIVTPLSTKDKVYYYAKGNKSNPIYLREKVSEFLNYKAFREGILSTTVLRKNKASKCYKCGGKIISKKLKRSKRLKTYCENNHILDYYFNYAMNVALDFLSKYK